MQLATASKQGIRGPARLLAAGRRPTCRPPAPLQLPHTQLPHTPLKLLSSNSCSSPLGCCGTRAASAGSAKAAEDDVIIFY